MSAEEEKTDTRSEKSEIGNPLYCSYVDGVYTYKDPSTQNEFLWDEATKQWKPKKVYGITVECVNGQYYYIDPKTRKTNEWDSQKSGWVTATKKVESNSAESSSSSSITATVSGETEGLSENETSGFRNPNYDSSLQSGSSQPRRFYYAVLSPSEMGVNEPVLFLSPDDQVNNNSTVSPLDEEEERDQSLVDPYRRPAIANKSTGSGLAPQREDPLLSKSSPSPFPPGWERHEDSSGAYYWHIKSGTIQREPPTAEQALESSSNNPALLIPGSLSSNSFRRSQTISCQLSNSPSVSFGSNNGFGVGSSSTGNNKSSITGTSASTVTTEPIPSSAFEMDKSEKRKSWSQFLENSEREREQERMREALLQERDRPKSESSLRFAGVSLGCLSISEENLTPERSSRAVSKVIAELTTHGHGIGVKGASTGIEVAGKIWGGGSELYLELDDAHLRVKTKERNLVVAEQPIHSIRVWGVGRDDPRDFAYVAREKVTRQFLCHVFRLEMNARPLASALRDACKKIMIERQQKQKRPTTLPTGLRKTAAASSVSTTTFFPTPMDEPRKVIKAFYLGSKIVSKPTGMDTLNAAIDSLRANEPVPVNISVAPSVVLIRSEEADNPKINVEIRVRYLSFMGIGRDIQTCGVIVHTSRDDFQAYCFYSTPSSGALAKSIEAACVLRYQKCLDAHHIHNEEGAQGSGDSSATEPTSSGTPSSKTASNLANALKNVLASFGRSKSMEEKV